jgi:magnesium-transporting ATPase (P-type)
LTLNVVIINALIGFLQEGKAERALEAVRAMLASNAMVMRDGSRAEIAAEELVPSDLVLLDPGARVPADLRLLWVMGLRLDESALTSESLPAEKSTEAVAVDAPIAFAIGTRVMARERVIVRRLPAVETLGSVTLPVWGLILAVSALAFFAVVGEKRVLRRLGIDRM